MAILIVQDGAYVSQDVNDKKSYEVDWGTDNLPDGVLISSSTFTITRLRGAATPPLEKDSEGLVTGSRSTTLRLFGGARGGLYQIDNHIVTNESPAQETDRHWLLGVRDK